jgi:hypothetical protein
MTRRPHHILATVALACALAGISGCAAERVGAPTPTLDGRAPVSGEQSSGGDPHFLTADEAGPRIANPVVKFWAKQGEDRIARMYYASTAGARDSSTFVELRVRAASLAAYPDGRAFARGDSVLITISLLDPERLIIDCQPSGLRFSASRPATLKMSYLHTDAAPTIERSLRIWRREAASDPWTVQASSVEVGLHEVESSVFGFSGYAIAY